MNEEKSKLSSLSKLSLLNIKLFTPMNEEKSKSSPLETKNAKLGDYSSQGGFLAGSNYWKFVGKFLLIIVVAIGALWGGFVVQQWQGAKNVEKFAEALETWQKDQYDLAMQDTYGGKTPQETLQMYIDAVEKGDYELASKYFILEKQEKELSSLRNSTKEDIINIANILKNLERVNDQTMKTKVKGYDFIVNFSKYPNGIWKILEI